MPILTWKTVLVAPVLIGFLAIGCGAISPEKTHQSPVSQADSDRKNEPLQRVVELCKKLAFTQKGEINPKAFMRFGRPHPDRKSAQRSIRVIKEEIAALEKKTEGKSKDAVDPQDLFSLAERYADLQSMFEFMASEIESKTVEDAGAGSPVVAQMREASRSYGELWHRVIQRIIEVYPSYVKRDEAMYLLAYEVERLAQENLSLEEFEVSLSVARNYYQQVIEAYPDSEYATKSRYMLAVDLFYNQHNCERAMPIFMDILARTERYPEHAFGAALLLADCHLARNENEAAASVFRNVIENSYNIWMQRRACSAVNAAATR